MGVHSLFVPRDTFNSYEEYALACGQAYARAEEEEDQMEDWWDCRLRGSLKQIAQQRRFLKARGLKIWKHGFSHLWGHHDFKDALKAIWTAKVPGWAQYEYQLLEKNVCSKSEFRAAMNSEKTKHEKK